jgi:hypothetical protein
MSPINLSGKWTGVIVYGKKYRKFQGQELFFDAELIQENNSISGTAIDVGGTGMSPDMAVISGAFSSNIISFIKRYKSLHYLDEKGEAIIEKTREGDNIFYSGVYDEATGTFKGNWEYRLTYKIFGIIPFKYIVGGTWTMTRKLSS